jgi:hypothetical protein
VNESLWTAGVKKIKNGMRMKEVFDLIGGPNNFEDIRFVMGGVSVFPEDTNEAEGVSPWIYQSDKLELLINIEWKDGRVSAVPIRAFKKTPVTIFHKTQKQKSEIKSEIKWECYDFVYQKNDEVQSADVSFFPCTNYDFWHFHFKLPFASQIFCKP